MLSSVTVIQKKEEELTDLQKRLKNYFQSEEDRLEKELNLADESGDTKEYYNILLQQIEIMKFREQAGLIICKSNRKWWHT